LVLSYFYLLEMN